MKIGLVCPYNIGRGGGVQECVVAMQMELKRRGHEALIITPMSKEAKENPPADTILLGTGADVRLPSLKTTAQFSASFDSDELQQILDEHEFDILHFHEPQVPMLSRQLLSKSKAINVATFHALLPDSVMTRTFRTVEKAVMPYTKSILKDIHALTAVSNPAAEYVRSITKHPVVIIPNGIDLKKYTQQLLPRAPTKLKRVLYIGRLEGRKGVKHLIDAFARMDDPHARLLIAGDGPEREKLEFYVNENNIEHVKFLGFVSERKKQRLLHKADVFCSPAVHGESFGIVLLEAMASGIVTIAGNNPGYVSVMQERGALSVVNPHDVDEFTRRLRLLLNDKELAALWREWALKYVQQFDYVKVVDQYEKLYKRLLKERP